MGETAVQLFRIIDFGYYQNNGIARNRNSLNHQRFIVNFKSIVTGSLLQHFAKKLFCLIRAVGKLTELDIPADEILPGQGKTELIIIYLFDLHGGSPPFPTDEHKIRISPCLNYYI